MLHLLLTGVYYGHPHLPSYIKNNRNAIGLEKDKNQLDCHLDVIQDVR